MTKCRSVVTVLEYLFELLTNEITKDLMTLQERLEELTDGTLDSARYGSEIEMINCVMGRFLGEASRRLDARVYKLLRGEATDCKETFFPRFYDLGDFEDDLTNEIDELQYLEHRTEVAKHLIAAAERATAESLEAWKRRTEELRKGHQRVDII